MKENPRQPRAKDERREHPRGGNGEGAFEALGHDVHAEFHADDEHVERQPELRRGEEIALRVARGLCAVPREKPRLGVRREQPEKRRAEQHAGDHFRHHLRLAKARGHRPDQPAEKQDDGELEKELDGEVEVVHAVARTAGRRYCPRAAWCGNGN